MISMQGVFFPVRIAKSETVWWLERRRSRMRKSLNSMIMRRIVLDLWKVRNSI